MRSIDSPAMPGEGTHLCLKSSIAFKAIQNTTEVILWE
jgi:hypothetical protein